MSELSIDRKNLRSGFKPASDADLLKAAEIGSLVAELPESKFRTTVVDFDVARHGGSRMMYCMKNLRLQMRAFLPCPL